jgi:hypothetical protein
MEIRNLWVFLLAGGGDFCQCLYPDSGQGGTISAGISKYSKQELQSASCLSHTTSRMIRSENSKRFAASMVLYFNIIWSGFN